MLAYEMDGKPLPPRARRPRARRDPGDVRLQEREVGRADRARREARLGLLGAARLRRRRLGRTLERLWLARPRGPPALRRALHADRAAPPLGARERVLRPARLRARPLPPVALGGGRQAAADQGHPLLDRDLLGGRDPADRRCSATGAPSRRPSARSTSSTATTAASSPATPTARKAASTPARRSTRSSPPHSRRCSSSPACCSGTASATRASDSPAPSTSTTRSCTSRS